MEKLIATITQLLDEKKAEDIEVIDLRGKDYITDYAVIATALVGKHSFALLDTLKTNLKAQGVEFYGVEEESEDWIIADLGEVMIHIFTDGHRKKFNLEDFLKNLGKPQN